MSIYDRIRIVAFNDRNTAEKLSKHLPDIFSLDCKVSDSVFPQTRRRGNQFDARDIVYFLKKTRINRNELILGITEKDAFVPELNFVFGLADISAGTAMISMNRLVDINESIFFNRCLKEAVHELGHLFNLSHCDDPSCVMHFSNCLADTDFKSYSFCKKCKKLLRSDTH